MTKRGKQTCRILKEIRRKIAEANDIEYITSECQYQGECSGTCPKCEAEVRYLEQQLERKRTTGKVISVLGISAGLAALVSQTSCGNTTKKDHAEICQDTVVSPTVHVKDTLSAKDYMIGDEKDIMIVTEGDIGEKIKENALDDPKFINKSFDASDTATENSTYLSEDVTEGQIIFEEPYDKMPEFPGGQDSLMSFIERNIRQPKSAEHNPTNRKRVIVSFTIGKDGSLYNAKVVYSLNNYCDQEALRIVQMMPRWAPAIRKGEPVEINYTIPFLFK